MSKVAEAPSPRTHSPKTGIARAVSRIREALPMAAASVAILAAVVSVALAPRAASAAEPDDQRAAVDEMRKVADRLTALVRTELTKALEASGPMRGIAVCKYGVPEFSSSVSRANGWRVTRVSLRPRNPVLGAADAWEQSVLMQFEQRAARGERVETMEYHETVTEPAGRFLRYMRALPAGPLCAACHGPADAISDATRAQLAIEYPFDRATGYRAGQIRGAVTVKRPLD